MRQLTYSLVIEATEDPNFFGFYSPDLEGLSGTGTSIEDCMLKAPSAIEEFVELTVKEGLPVPPMNPTPIVTLEKSA